MDMIIANVLGVLIGLALGFMFQRMSATASRLERKLDALLRHSGINLDKAAHEEAAALMRKGDKIAAIKVYRDYTGCGLAEAKAKVESMI